MSRRLPFIPLGLGIFCYCCGFGFLLSLIYGILKISAYSTPIDAGTWLAFIGTSLFVIIAGVLGTGFIRLNKSCLKTLILLLALYVGVSTILVFMILILLVLSSALGTTFFQFLKDNFQTWPSFLFVFLAQIIVLYYLCRPEVRDSFD